MPTKREGNKNVIERERSKINTFDLLNFDHLVKKSVGTLCAQLETNETPAATKLAAARTVLELAGMLGPGRRVASDRDAADLSDDELRASIERRQAVLAARAKPVNAPNPDDDEPNILTELG